MVYIDIIFNSAGVASGRCGSQIRASDDLSFAFAKAAFSLCEKPVRAIAPLIEAYNFSNLNIFYNCKFCLPTEPYNFT